MNLPTDRAFVFKLGFTGWLRAPAQIDAGTLKNARANEQEEGSLSAFYFPPKACEILKSRCY